MSWYLDNPAHVRVATLEADVQHRRESYRLTLDTANDLELIRWIFGQLYPKSPNFTLDDVIALLDANPKWAKSNLNVQSKLTRGEINTRLIWDVSSPGA